MEPYVLGACLTYAFVFLVGQQYIGYRHDCEHIRSQPSPGRAGLLLTSIIMMAVAFVKLAQQPVQTTSMMIGSPIVIAGLALTLWAQWTLGPNWVNGTGLHRRHKLITSGPYLYMRHPMYVGILVSSIGLGIFSANILFAVAMLLYGLSFMIRIPMEEINLSKRFKVRHKDYSSVVGVLWPRFRP